MLADFQTAPIGDGLRETLRFLQTMTLTPESLGPADARRVLAAGVSAQALRDAIEVSTAFNLITRFADTIGARPYSARGFSPAQAIAARSGRFFDNGYA